MRRKSKDPKIIKRAAWGAVKPLETAPLGGIEPYKKPIVRICYNHTNTEECTSPKTCVSILQQRQKDDIECGFNDIVHNFIIGGDGNIYEGRGWDNVTGTINIEHWKTTLDIGFIGVYNEGEPPSEQLELANNLIRYGVKTEKIKDKYKIFWIRELDINEF